jgi:hypothetical protein
MAYANLYRKYIKKQVPAVKTSLKTRNIYKIESYEYVDVTKKNFRGPDASLVFLVGISPDRKLSVIKFSEVVPDRFFRWLKTMFKSSVTCKEIKQAIGNEEFETLLLSDTMKGGATFSKCTFDKSAAAVTMLASNPSLIADSTFISDGSNHAVQFTTAGSYSWTNNTVTGYATTNGTTGNEVFYNNTNGQVTVNVSGGTGVLSYRNGGTSTTTINSTVSVTVTGLKDNTEVRVLQFGTNTELAGIESATTGTTDNRSFTFSLSAATAVTIKIHSLLYEHISVNYTVPGSAASIPIQQRFDRNYQI